MDTPCRHPLDPLVEVMARLRGPDGCPWDKEQTHESLIPYMIEEAYEAVDAIASGDPGRLADELGDVLLQVVFHSRLAEEAGRFTIDDVVQRATGKMVRRHPHVFGTVDAPDTATVLRNWEAIKRQESAERGEGPGAAPGLLDDIPRHLPALMEAEKVQRRAARVGFEWPDVAGALAKVEEEWKEVQQAREEGDPGRLRQEWGDLLFALVNVARYLSIDSELALREANAKFRERFRYIETKAAALGKDLETMGLEEMDALWEEAKEDGAGPIPPATP